MTDWIRPLRRPTALAVLMLVMASGPDAAAGAETIKVGSQNVYILKVERVGGKLTNTVLHTYPLVSQFWTYKPEEFLKLPAYSRDYPPARP